MEFTDIAYASVTGDNLTGLQEFHKISQRDQFLMKLPPEFETVRSNLMSRQPCPSLETCLNEILRKEQQEVTQTHLSKQTSNGTLEVAYAVKGKLPAQIPRDEHQSSYQPTGCPHGPTSSAMTRDMSKIQCYRCKEYDHYASHCKKKF